MKLGELFAGYGGLGRQSPDPTELTPRGKHRLSAHFVEFMMGLAPGHVTGVDGVSRSEQLKMLGNGVVPQQAVAALKTLLGRHNTKEETSNG